MTIFLAGHRGLVGSAIKRRLAATGASRILTRPRCELNLEDAAAVAAFFAAEQPDVVILAAALVGGIQANRTRPADFIGRNLAIQQSVIWGAHLAGINRLIFLGSSCAYPRITAQPIPEQALLTGPLEPTNAPYAVAKIAGSTLCTAISTQYGRQYMTLVPPNVYGPGDNFDPEASHVAAGMMLRFHQNLPDAPVVCWGSGTPRREFLFVDDLADACVWLLLHPGPLPSLVNVGTGTAISILELAETIQRVVGHRGAITWDTSMPDGFPEKTMDVSALRSLGWQSRTSLEDGLHEMYSWYVETR